MGMAGPNNPIGDSSSTPVQQPNLDSSSLGPSGESPSQVRVQIPRIVIQLFCGAFGLLSAFFYLYYSETALDTLLSFVHPFYQFSIFLTGTSDSSSLLQNANGPAYEASLSFHDLVIGLLFPLLLGVLTYIFILLSTYPSHRLILERQ